MCVSVLLFLNEGFTSKAVLGHAVEFQVSLFQYGTDLGQERAGDDSDGR